jgi:hypothetical protein
MLAPATLPLSIEQGLRRQASSSGTLHKNMSFGEPLRFADESSPRDSDERLSG